MAKRTISEHRTRPSESSAPQRSRYSVESVARSAQILALLATETQLRISDVAERLECGVSTAHRLLTTLEDEGLLRQNETTRCYEPGPTLLAVARTITPHRSRWDFARPYLADLAERVGETVSLNRRQGDDIVFVESIEAPSSLRVSSRRGAVMSAHCTSGGKLVLAQLSDTELHRLYPEPTLPAMTAKSIVSRDALLTELRRVRKRGYGTNFGESEHGISGVAVAIAFGVDEEYALAVAAPSSRLAAGRVSELVVELRATARLVAEAATP